MNKPPSSKPREQRAEEKDRATIIVNKYADLMMPKEEAWNELEAMIRQSLLETEIRVREETIRECAELPRGRLHILICNCGEQFCQRVQAIRTAILELLKGDECAGSGISECKNPEKCDIPWHYNTKPMKDK